MTLSDELLNEKSVSLYQTNAVLDTERYTSADYLALEKERVWGRAWHVVCRETEVSEPGAYFEHVAGDEAVVVVRGPDAKLRALSNVCRHRGTPLMTGSGIAKELRCPFHGWRYGLDGELLHVPNAWDFDLGPERMCLPEYRADTWGGWVFVCLDPTAPPLAEYLAPMPDMVKHWGLDGMVKQIGVGLVMPANWKVLVEAFIEVYHTPWAHPQTAIVFDEVNSPYRGGIGSHVGWYATRVGAASPNLVDMPDEDDVLEAWREFFLGGDESIELELGDRTAVEFIADYWREFAAPRFGIDASDWPDDAVVDAETYFVFPNLICFVGFSGVGGFYRFLPYGDDPNKSIYEFYFVAPPSAVLPHSVLKDGVAEEEAIAQDASAEPPTVLYPEGTTFSDVLGPRTGAVLDQDVVNVARLQQLGLRSRNFPGPLLARYQESVVRFFHEVLDEYMSKP